MALHLPDMNPLRFRETSNDPDYSTLWPNYRNITQRVNNIPGMYATQFFKDHIVNRTITIQFEETTSYDHNITVYKYNTAVEVYQYYSTIYGTDITPSGWISGDIYSYEFTPTESGVYYILYESGGVQSDEFVVHSDILLKKYLVEISFYNTINDYGMIFYDDAVSKYTGLTFFTGILQNYDPRNETSAYTNDRGGEEILKSTPMHAATLTLTNIHHSYIENINLIFSCDRIEVNGIDYSRSDPLDIEPLEKSDLVNIKIKLVKRITSYYAST